MENIRKRQHIAFFSQTGSEIYQISKKLGRFPDMIITNNDQSRIKINEDLLKEANQLITTLPKKPTIEEYRSLLEPNDFITLHGWLRIIPPEICSNHEIYNGHPGLINVYPELKGKDPQERAFKGKYDEIGTVIHKVVAEVDAGEIVASCSTRKLANMSLDNIIETVHDLSVNLWIEFLKGKI